MYIIMCNHISGGQNYLLLAMDIAKVGGPLSVVKICTSMLCKNRVSLSGWSPIGCEGLYFHAMCENRVSLSGWSLIGCEGLHTKLNICLQQPLALTYYSKPTLPRIGGSPFQDPARKARS